MEVLNGLRVGLCVRFSFPQKVLKGPDTFFRLKVSGSFFDDLNCENGFFVPHLQCLTPGAKAGGYSSLEMRVMWRIRDFFTHRSKGVE